MARTLTLLLCALCLSACKNEDPAPLYFKADYQLRCGGCTPRVSDEPERNIEMVEGEEGGTMSCSVENIGGRDVLSFDFVRDVAGSNDDYGFRIRQIDVESKAPGSACRVRATEGSNAFEGKCKSPGDDGKETCEIEIEVSGETVTGSVYCNDVPDSETGYTRDLVRPGTADKPVEFEIFGCRGL